MDFTIDFLRGEKTASWVRGLHSIQPWRKGTNQSDAWLWAHTLHSQPGAVVSFPLEAGHKACFLSRPACCRSLRVLLLSEEKLCRLSSFQGYVFQPTTRRLKEPTGATTQKCQSKFQNLINKSCSSTANWSLASRATSSGGYGAPVLFSINFTCLSSLQKVYRYL